MIRNPKIELLSPAKNIDVGMAAINHGADAVYIGPDRFGARVAAGNSVQDIARLAAYAHSYQAKVYVTVNTIIYENELEDVRRLIYELYDAGVDALIVQDMALLEMDLPPIALHASTQCDNRTVEKVQFLESVGFGQVVLARETPLDTMRLIASETHVALEAFVHGALCVCYSGRCYMSQAVKGRSANRGACAQMCRLPYILTDADGRIYAKDKHLLSLKDFDASCSIADMIDAGISSFKIEGRLKDEHYVKNITAYYRQKIDAILAGDDCRSASSLGTTKLFFMPDPKKTFFRGATDYFLHDRVPNIWSFDTPKSMGEPVGRVRDVWRNALSVDTKTRFANGDGLCFINEHGEFVGFRVNRVEQGRLLPFRMPDISRGTPLYRNSDAAFEKVLDGKTSQRKIAVDISVKQQDDTLVFSIKDDSGLSCSVSVDSLELQPANNPERSTQMWCDQLSRLGNTRYEARSVDVSALALPWFVQASVLNGWRDLLVSRFDAIRLESYRPSPLVERTGATIADTASPSDIPTKTLDYTANVANSLARKFYEKHGVESIRDAFELKPADNAELMRTRHCIRYAMGWCAKSPRRNGQAPNQLYIQTGSDRFALFFDCARCEMIIKSTL